MGESRPDRSQRYPLQMKGVPFLLDEVDRRITQLVIEGLANKEISARLKMPEGTVKWRLHRLYERAGVQSRSQFVLRIREWVSGGDQL